MTMRISLAVSLMIKRDRMRAILSVKYFEKEVHNVSNEGCSGSAFDFCRCRIVLTDCHIWRGFSEFVEIIFFIVVRLLLTSCDCIDVVV